MMSKKKKDKTDEPAKPKSKRSSKKASPIILDGTPAQASESLPPPKPQSAGARKKKGAAPLGLSSDDIALRAYYISEHRRHRNLPGDEMADWVEAERQLRSEAGKKSA
ncbi:MAG TPA: DUF2934 domain-containing protein [Terrimicrobiaceae bacterium]